MPYYPFSSILPGSTQPVIAGVPALYGLARAIAGALTLVGWGEVLTVGNPTYSPVNNTVSLLDGAIEAWRGILGDPPPTLLTPTPVPVNPPPLGTGFTYRMRFGWRVIGTGQRDTETVDTRNTSGLGGITIPSGFFPISGGVFPRFVSAPPGWRYILQASNFDGSPITLNVSSFRTSTTWVPTGVISVEIFPVLGSQQSSSPQLFRFPQSYRVNRDFIPSPIPPTIPLPVTVPGGTPGFPYPQVIPLEIPTPYDLPSRPIPLLSPPGSPDVPQLLPPIILTPEGLQIGDPSPGIQNGQPGSVVIPQQGVGTTDQTEVEPERRRDRRIPPLDSLCCPERSGDEIDYDKIAKIVFEELDKKLPPARPTTLKTQVLGGGSGVTAVSSALPDFSLELKVELEPPTDFPRNKQQFGGVGGKDVYYCGWISFGYNSEPSERVQLQYLKSSWGVPSGSSYATITATYGCTIKQVEVSYLETVAS